MSNIKIMTVDHDNDDDNTWLWWWWIIWEPAGCPFAQGGDGPQGEGAPWQCSGDYSHLIFLKSYKLYERQKEGTPWQCSHDYLVLKKKVLILLI